eukprot:10521171-Karenia_brevis.AAC.1
MAGEAKSMADMLKLGNAISTAMDSSGIMQPGSVAPLNDNSNGSNWQPGSAAPHHGNQNGCGNVKLQRLEEMVEKIVAKKMANKMGCCLNLVVKKCVSPMMVMWYLQIRQLKK